MINREFKSSFALRSSGNREPRVMALRTVSNIPGIKAAACNTKTSGVIGGEALDSNLRAHRI
jgi:hypothetical protein